MNNLIKFILTIFLYSTISSSFAMEDPDLSVPDQSTSRKRKQTSQVDVTEVDVTEKNPKKIVKKRGKEREQSSSGYEESLESPFAILPPEVVSHLIPFLPPKDLSAFAITSKTNRNLVEDFYRHLMKEEQPLFSAITTTMPWQITYCFRVKLLDFFRQYHQKIAHKESPYPLLERSHFLAKFCEMHKLLSHSVLLQGLWRQTQSFYPNMGNWVEQFFNHFLKGVYYQDPFAFELGLLMHHFSVTLRCFGTPELNFPFQSNRISYHAAYLIKRGNTFLFHELVKDYSDTVLLELADNFYDSPLNLYKSEAFYLWKLAAKKGNAEALFCLGCCYHLGYGGVSIDLKEAIRLYQLAADKGHVSAQLNLGIYHQNNKNFSEAVKWYQLAADQGDPGAQVNLGFCYYHGLGVIQNRAEALTLYSLSAEKGNKNAQFHLGQYHLGCEPKNLNEALKWFQLSSAQGLPEAQCKLGELYYHGLGIEKNPAEAAKLFQLSADQGYPLAQFFLGKCYHFGRGVNKDLLEAIKWYQLAANQGNPEALCAMGTLYRRGQGVEKNHPKAVELYKLAAEKGNREAQYLLGVYYCQEGENQDFSQGIKWLQIAAMKGHASAQCDLGICYELGQGVPKDHEEAKKWYQLAANQGHRKAKLKLTRMEKE